MAVQSVFKICPNCGFKSEPDSKFCLHCGEDIEAVEVTKSMEYGMFRQNNTKYLSSGKPRTGDRITGRIFASSDPSETQSYKAAWTSAYKNLMSVLDMEELNGAIHLTIDSKVTSNGRFIVIINGDGIITDNQSEIQD